ncbi:MAG: class II fructose-bisphosphate aldolase [Anaerolineaceae bacterium]|nr:class II fructose-bisphosphate aldolase [Anaerolineaceae bacterium]
MLVNMKKMLTDAKNGGYAVGFFNAINVEMARAVIESAEELRAPVMIGTAEILLPVMSMERVAEYLIPMAQKASVPVTVHYDHGLTFGKCMEALKLGFTSVMYDCSTAPYEDNLSSVAEMVRICHAMDVTVEAELGHVGDTEGEGKLTNPEDYYTDPDVAMEYVKTTGVDALAVAVGNAHGDYKFPPKLDFDRISAISQKCGIPLVLHGGSGLSDYDFKEAAKRGICKVNIFTDLDRAGKIGIEKGLSRGAKFASSLVSYEINAMKAVVREKILLLGSDGKA